LHPLVLLPDGAAVAAAALDFFHHFFFFSSSNTLTLTPPPKSCRRGVSTDVQYIGDSHVYYKGKPKLVKQWRKQDFANQYFTMSMQRLPGNDGVHWPV